MVELSKQSRQIEERRGEDDRDDASHVDLDRDVGVGPAKRAATDHALGVLNGHATLRLLNEHDKAKDEQTDAQDDDEDFEALSLGHGPQGRGEGGGNRHENQQRHSITDPALCDHFTEPHDEAGASRHGDDHQHDGVPGVIREQLVTGRDSRVSTEERSTAGDGDQGG